MLVRASSRALLVPPMWRAFNRGTPLARLDHECCAITVCPPDRLPRHHAPDVLPVLMEPAETLLLQKDEPGLPHDEFAPVERVHDRIQDIVFEDVEPCVCQEIEV